MAWHDIVAKLLAKLTPKVKVEIKNPVVIANLNIHITNNSQDQDISYDPGKEIYKINLVKLTEDIKKGLISSEMLDDDRILLEDSCKKTIEDFRSQEKLAETQEKIKFLDKKIPQDDLNIWRAALYLRHCDNTIALKGRVVGLKFQLMQKYGDKGRNIANLCTANYLEDWLIPAYGELSETLNNDDLTKKEFGKIYNHLVNELPFTIFVCRTMSIDGLKDEIMRRKEFGINFINIHAIGNDNVQKVKIVIPDIEKDSHYCEERKTGRIFVRIFFKKEENKKEAIP